MVKLELMFPLSKSLDKEEVLSKCKELDNVSKYLQDNEIIKEIYVQKRLLTLWLGPNNA